MLPWPSADFAGLQRHRGRLITVHLSTAGISPWINCPWIGCHSSRIGGNQRCKRPVNERGMRGYYWHCHAICQSPQTDDRAPTATIRRLKFRRRQNRKKSKRKCTHAPESLISGCDDDPSGWTGGSYRRQCIWVFAFGNGAGRNGSRMGISVCLEPYKWMLFLIFLIFLTISDLWFGFSNDPVCIPIQGSIGNQL